jgi:glycerophosphoryl diester phosphodiesterase
MKIFAHRGFSHRFPEATLQAYQGAIDAGADGFECDLRLSRDMVLVCFHDRTTKRVGGFKKAVSRQTAVELKKVANVLTFAELLDLAISAKKDLLVETKHPVRSRGKVETELLKLLKLKNSQIEQAGIKVTVMSFSYLAVRRAKQSYPDVAKVIKYTVAALFNRQKKVAVNIEILRKHPGLLTRMRASDILVWTVNDRNDIAWLQKRTVDGLITDRVARARKMLRS